MLVRSLAGASVAALMLLTGCATPDRATDGAAEPAQQRSARTNCTRITGSTLCREPQTATPGVTTVAPSAIKSGNRESGARGPTQ